MSESKSKEATELKQDIPQWSQKKKPIIKRDKLNIGVCMFHILFMYFMFIFLYVILIYNILTYKIV